LFLVIWKNISKGIFAGIECLDFVLQKENMTVSACGINEKVKTIYDYYGFVTGKMKHFYILNSEKKGFKIAKIEKNIYSNSDASKHLCLENEIVKFEDFEQFKNEVNLELFRENKFFKSSEYLKKRYFTHPYYLYDKYGVLENDKVVAIVIARKIEINNSSCYRIIDFIGDEEQLRKLSSFFVKLISDNNYEYIDFYQIGIDDDIMLKAGFVERTENDSNIIPNYFEPFLPKNIELYYCTTCKEKFKMFKGDGDQDRPSVAKSKLKKDIKSE
ncbi:MAG: hypothetical protein ACRC0V_07115, partial [Fusobacteriaceae bacterium]